MPVKAPLYSRSGRQQWQGFAAEPTKGLRAWQKPEDPDEGHWKPGSGPTSWMEKRRWGRTAAAVMRERVRSMLVGDSGSLYRDTMRIVEVQRLSGERVRGAYAEACLGVRGRVVVEGAGFCCCCPASHRPREKEGAGGGGRRAQRA